MYLDHFINIHNTKDDTVKVHVKVCWMKEELGDSGWQSGWYVGKQIQC